MNLARYVDQVAEWSYHDDDDLLGYLDEWEARQPPPVTKSKRQLKAVQNAGELRKATKVAERKTLPEEMPDLFQPEQEVPSTMTLQILDEMAEEHQHRNYTLEPAKSTLQIKYYRMWREVFVRKGFAPVLVADLSRTLHEQLIYLFPEARKVSEYAVIFGFGDCLPKLYRPTPVREAELCYRGFFARCDLETVRADHDQVLRDVRAAAEVRKQEERAKAELQRQRDAEIMQKRLIELRRQEFKAERARQQAEQARRDAEARQRAEQVRQQAERQRQAQTQAWYQATDVERPREQEPILQTYRRRIKVASRAIERILRRCGEFLDEVLG